MKVVINECFGGFGLSDAAYEKLIEWGIPVRKYIPPLNDGEVIFDNTLSDERVTFDRYWETWINDKRTYPLLIKVVETLGKKANGRCAELKVVEIPDGVERLSFVNETSKTVVVYKRPIVVDEMIGTVIAGGSIDVVIDESKEKLVIKDS